MAIGDRHVRELSTGDDYTPSGNLKEVITNVAIDPLASLEMSYSGQTDYVRISPTLGPSTPQIQQDPRYLLTSDVTIRCQGFSLYGTNNSTSSPALYIANPLNPNSSISPFGEVGELFSIAYRAYDIDIFPNGDVLVVSNASSNSRTIRLYRVNPSDPDDETGNYGFIGSKTYGLTFFFDAIGVAIDDSTGNIYVIIRNTSGVSRLVILNPDNISDTTGIYNNGSTISSGFTNFLGGMVYDSRNNGLYTLEGTSLWYINPLDPRSTTSPYGEVGSLPSGLGTSLAIAIRNDGNLYVVGLNNNLWLINPFDPDDETGIYGEVGTLNFTPDGIALASGGTVDANARISTVEVA